MTPEISEFSYGYALTSELISRFSLKSAGAPEFATQYAEGKKGGGWDVKLPAVPIYLQIKRSDIMLRRNAKESSIFTDLPFYRMHLHRRDHSNQQQLLLDLEARGNMALYVAPSFSLSSELHTYYSGDKVADNSIFVKPSSIGPLPDDNYHWISFQSNSSHAYFCSEPKPIETELPEILFNELIPTMSLDSERQVDEQLMDQIGNELLDVYLSRLTSIAERNRIEKIRGIRDRRSPSEFAQLISRTLFDCELLIYQSLEQTK